MPSILKVDIRFINPERVSPPDVDMDFDYYRRDEIFEYVYQKYGREFCSKIGTYGTLKVRAVIRATAKALDLGKDWESYQEAKKKNASAKLDDFKKSLEIADYLAKLTPKVPDVTLESAMKDSEEFRSAAMRYGDFLDYALHCEKVVSNAGVHAAGIIICKNKISDYVPMRESKGQLCAQFTGPEVEELGLLKFDFLALKTLTVIEDALRAIKERHNVEIDIDNLEPNDQKVFKLFNGGYNNMDNRGIFQFESVKISQMVRNIQIDRFQDLVACNALYRPGPLKAGIPDMYADYKHNRKKLTYLHPMMGEVLKDTYGCMIFQENLMKVSQVLAGFTKGQSDTLRKVIGKKKPELIKKEHLDEKFIAGCVANGIDKDIAKKIFEQIEYFGGYGFNIAHAAAYSFLAYQTAWLKIYYPIEFMCNLLSSEIDNADKGLKLASYIREATRMGLVILGPHINKSKLKFSIERGMSQITGKPTDFIRTPFTTVDGIGEVASKSIVENQPYTSLKDFLTKTSGGRVNTNVFAKLVEKNSMDDAWRLSHAELLAGYEKVKDEISKEKAAKKKQLEYIAQQGDEEMLWLGGSGADLKM